MTSTPPANLHAAPFHTTRWTRVCLAKADSEDGRRALADLCDTYYEPVVAFLRCELRDADAARDMSHSFFTEMLAGGTIDRVDQERGRFRSYLLGAVKHFVAHHREWKCGRNAAVASRRSRSMWMLPSRPRSKCLKRPDCRRRRCLTDSGRLPSWSVPCRPSMPNVTRRATCRRWTSTMPS